jgi:drug/metabolite transporter (DMT)-like permease
MGFGTLVNVLVAMPSFLRVPWGEVSTFAWFLLLPTSLLAGCFSFIAWYAAVQTLGPSRTSVYSNVSPIVAMASAAAWLGEAITPIKIIGATAVLGGVALTRLGHLDRARNPDSGG